MPSGNCGLLGGLGSCRLQIVVATQCLDDTFQAHAHLGLIDLDAPRALTVLVEPLLRCAASTPQIIESLGDAADLVALLAANLHQFVMARLDHMPMPVDETCEVLDSCQ